MTGRIAHCLITVLAAVLAATGAEDKPPRALLTVKDLTFEGQVGAPESTYANATLALRYVGKERRFLTYDFDPAQPDAVGDLIEYKVGSPLKNGANDSRPWSARTSIPRTTASRPSTSTAPDIRCCSTRSPTS
jgi:hypothetical protein